MIKVSNLTDRVVSFLGWRVLPKSGDIINPQGQRCATMPLEIAYGSQAKRLKAQGVISIGDSVLAPAPKKEVKAPAAEVMTSAAPVVEKKDETGKKSAGPKGKVAEVKKSSK